MMVIDPDECIDCAVCVPECPVNAIWAEEDLPSDQKSFLAINQKIAITGTAINRKKSPLPNAEAWINVPGKAILAQSSLTNFRLSEIEETTNKLKNLATAEELSPNEWSIVIKDPNPLIRLAVVARPDFSYERSRLDLGLADSSDDIRRFCIEKYPFGLTNNNIETLLLDPSPAVRQALISVKAEAFTKDQIDFTLKDSESKIRQAVIQLPWFKPTDQQFFRLLEIGNLVEIKALFGKVSNKQMTLLLTHSSADIRAAAFGYLPFSLSKAQIQKGLKDTDKRVRLTVIGRDDINLSPPQFVEILGSADFEMIDIAIRKANIECIEEGLKNNDESIGARVINKSMKISTDQLNRCISDQRSLIALTALKKIDKKITKNQIKLSLKSNNPEIRRLSLNLYGVDNLTPKQFDACLSDSDETIRFLASSCNAFKLNDFQMEKALLDKALRVRLAAASREDFSPTIVQLKRGLGDRSQKVREIFSSRFSLVKGKIIDVKKQENIKPDRKLKIILNEIISLKTWTSKKYQLKDELLSTLEKLNYIQFSVDARKAWLFQFGEHTIIDVPPNKRGHLQQMRGKKAHLVCVGQGRYSTILFAAKAL